MAVYDGSGDLMYWNILGAGEIIGRAVREASSTDRQYYVKDHLGSIRGTINEGGSVDHQSDYYPFGLEMPSRVWTTDPPRERYTGHEIEELGSNTTWYYAGARMYDPVVARWMTTDPLAEKFPGWSAYNYVGGNPINLFDPDGMAPMGADCCRLSNVLRSAFSWVRPTIREGERRVKSSQLGTVGRAITQATGAASDFKSNYDDMREANTVGADVYFHCMANCEASQRGTVGRETAKIVSAVREVVDYLVKGDPIEEVARDLEANDHGRMGAADGECTTVCIDYKPDELDEDSQ